MAQTALSEQIEGTLPLTEPQWALPEVFIGRRGTRVANFPILSFVGSALSTEI